jgi:uncharacterized membrane protein
MKISWRSEIISIFFIIASFVLAAIAWPHAPDRIPIHWGLSGQPDGYAGKMGLFYLPLITLGIYLLLLFLPSIDPGKKNYEKFKSTYLIIRTILVIFFVCIQIFTVLWALGKEVNVNIALPVIVGLLLVTLGNFFGKFRPNWFAGIRTPWTLSSDESWNKTHRLGGWLFVLFGIVLVIIAPFQWAWVYIFLVVIILIILVVLFVYSYIIWKKDPDARSIGGRRSNS